MLGPGNLPTFGRKARLTICRESLTSAAQTLAFAALTAVPTPVSGEPQTCPFDMLHINVRFV